MNKKKSLNLVFLFLITSFFFAGCKEKSALVIPPPTVTVTPVVQDNVKEYEKYVGQAVAIESVNLLARITGFIEEQPVSNGQFAKKGDTIFLIQQEQYKAEVLAAEGDLEKANAALTNAQIEYDRQKQLVKSNAVSVREFDLAAAQLGEAQGAVKLAQANLINANLNLSYTEIKAPFDGKVGIATYDPGNLVRPTSESLINIVQYDPILFEFSVPESKVLDYLQKLRKDETNISTKSPRIDEIELKLILSNGDEYPTPGSIYYTGNTVDPLTGSMIIRGTFENKDRLLIPGSYATVVMQDKVSKSALLMPQAAMQQDQIGSYVFVLDKNNTVQRENIKVGALYGIFIEVKDGLKEGDLVVYEGAQKIQDGEKVAPTTINLNEYLNNDK